MRNAVLRLLLLIPLGLVAALLVGCAIAVAASLSSLGEADAYAGFPRGELLVPSLAVLFLVSPFLLGGLFAFALIAEVFAIRSWIFHAIAGAIIAVVGCRLLGLAGEGAVFTDEIALAAGLSAGLTYWLVAGRSAGLVATSTRVTPPPSSAGSRHPAAPPQGRSPHR